MKRFAIYLIITFNFSLLTFNFGKGQVPDKKAVTILDDLSNKTKAYKNIRIEFSYVMENKTENIKESKDGTVLLKGDKFNLDISGQNVISDGKTSWTYIKDADEIHINNVNKDDESISFNKLLTNYNKDFKSKLIREEKQGLINVYIIDLTPKKGETYHKVRLTINKDKMQVISAVVFDKNGSTYSYIVKKFLPDAPLSDDLFTFKTSDHPKAEVIDMR
jgi:outer membrane lipoprotein carrier protein